MHPANYGYLYENRGGLLKTVTDRNVPSDDVVLNINGLSTTFGNDETAVTAVKDIPFDVKTGEALGLLGPNWAGKTTTIRTILGLILLDEDEVYIRGVDIFDQPRQAYARVNDMFEGTRHAYWWVTVRENLRYFEAIRGENPNAPANRHETILEQREIGDKAETKVCHFSRGNKQMLPLTSIFIANFSIIFLDELTLGLYVDSSLKLQCELVRLADAHGKILPFSSHDTDVIKTVCERVIIMNEGQTVANDTAENLLNHFTTNSYQITTPDCVEAILCNIRDGFNLKNVEQDVGQIQFEVTIESGGFYPLTDVMKRHRVELNLMDTVKPNLAEVFVDMTGEYGSAVHLGSHSQGSEFQ